MPATDREYMQLAIEEAVKAGQIAEVPVGAVLVDATGTVVARAHNETITRKDPSAHAEMLAIRAACEKLDNYRLTGMRIFTTIEPCIMCMGAIIHARLAEVVYGARDPKWGAAGSLYDFSTDPRFNHRLRIVAGVQGRRCADLMKTFFAARRRSQTGRIHRFSD
jgi:tRNA(Arg) A34 adenosine deaminase TadA